MRGNVRYAVCVFSGALALSCVSPARAQEAAVQTATAAPVLDERGAPLKGTDPSAAQFGLPDVKGDLVQILQFNGRADPPGTDGQPGANNPVLYTARIGVGVTPSASNSGMFGASIVPRPSGQIFARIFNAPSLQNSSFYADSQVFTVNGNDVFIPQVAATDRPLDSGDNDGDGVNNSWEKSLGSNPQLADSDGDGVADGDEFRAGTDLTDAGSFLRVDAITPFGSGALRVEWASVSGKTYQVQFAAGSEDFTNVTDVITASMETASAVLTNLASLGQFRIQLVE